MTAVLAYEIPTDVADTTEDEQRIVRIVLICGLAYAALQFVSTTLGFCAMYISFPRRGWASSLVGYYYYPLFGVYLLMGIVLYDALRSRISAPAVRRWMIVFLILAFAGAVVWFLSYFLEPGFRGWYAGRMLVILCAETFTQDAGSLWWLLIMIWALPRNGRKFMSSRRAIVLGVATFAVLVLVRFTVPFLYPGNRSVVTQLQQYLRSTGGVAVMVLIAGAIVAAALCAPPAVAPMPRMRRLRALVILILLVLPPILHTLLSNFWNRSGGPPEFTVVARNCSFVSLLCWTIARGMPAIALACLAWSDWRRDRTRPAAI